MRRAEFLASNDRFWRRGAALLFGALLALGCATPAIAGKTATTTSLSPSANPSTRGQVVTLTATVSPSAATGTITFLDGTTTIGTATLSGGTASMVTSSLTVGTHSLKATYGGAQAYASSSSAVVSEVVNKVNTTTALGSSSSSAPIGTSNVFTATIAGYQASGTVTFKDGTNTIGTATASNGSAAITTSALAVGPHTLTAVYAGDANNTGSTSPAFAFTVTKVVPTLSLTSSAAFIPAGTAVQLSVAVTGYNTPSGNITFYDGAAGLGSSAISAGVANYSATLSGASVHRLSASFAGDANNLAATSNAVDVQLTQGATTAPGAMTWLYGYDPQGNLAAVVDPLGRETGLYVDRLQRLTNVALPSAAASAPQPMITRGYDSASNLTSVQDPRNITTTYAFNGLAAKTAQSSPDSGAESFTYDVAGNVLTRTDARDKTTTYAYDGMGRLTSATYPTGTASVFQYDGGVGGPATSAGRLSLITDESGSTTYGYDVLGRLLQKTQVTGSRSFTVQYAWGTTGSATGKLASITYPSGSRVNYSYDAYGRVSSVTVNPVNANGVGTNTASTLTLASAATYNGQGVLTGFTWADGSVNSRSLDTFGRPTSYILGLPSGTGAAAGLMRTLTYNDAGLVTGYSHTQGGIAAPTFDQSFAYDELNRLSSATLATASYGYGYDSNGNRTSQTVGGTSYTNTIATTSNRVSTSQDPAGTSSFAYDAAGNILSDGSATYTYSDRGRMASATVGSNTVYYTYNTLDQRVSKTGPTTVVPSGAAYYVYGQGGELLGEYDANGSPLYETIYMGMMPIGVMRQSGAASTSTLSVQLYNVFADHLGAPRVITRQSDQVIVWRWDAAEPFGNMPPNSDPSGLGTFTFNQRFPGQVADLETGNFQNWHRDYRPRLGRYVQSDPIGLGGGINTYAYVGASPVGNVDPLGLFCVSANGTTACFVPDGPNFKVPTPEGFPDYLGPNGPTAWYHKYDIRRPIGCADAGDVMQGLINRPTPDDPIKPRPATPQGTLNDARVPQLPLASNFVKSYITTDLRTGMPVEVNMAGALASNGPLFGPGYVARYVADGLAHTAGEGGNIMQWPFDGLQDWANQKVWGRQMEDIISRSKRNSSCECPM